jgi:hypothetical protein
MLTFILHYWWILFLACLLLFILTALWMKRVGQQFIITSHQLRFGIFDLEFPVSEYSLDTLISRMDEKVRKALRLHLRIDYLFMPAAYVGIALLCIKTASKMSGIGNEIFWVLAALQILPWLFDVLENGYLVRKTRTVTRVTSEPDKNSADYRRFQFWVRAKFAVALTGAVCSLFGLLYFWIAGAFQPSSLPYLGGAALLVVIYLFAGNSLVKKPVVQE